MILKPKKEKEVSFIKYKLRSVPTKVLYKQQKKVKLTMDPQQSNPVYRHFRNQRNNRNVFQFLLSSAFDLNPRMTFSQKQIRDKTYSPNFKVFIRHERTHTCHQLQTLRTQGQNIFQEADRMAVDLKQKKKKISILSQYNFAVDRYCKFLPKTYEQNQKELMIAHEEVRKLCTEQLFPKRQNTASRVASMKHYNEPKIPFKLAYRNRTHRRTKTAAFEDRSDKFDFKHHTVHL